jgi:acyl-CoA synthetase (AMP-forming)/AMP-acid ligase II
MEFSFMERNIAHLLRLRAEEHGDDIAFRYLVGEGEQPETLTYEELHLRASEVAAGLMQHLHPGDRALMLYPSGLEFISAFFGCLYAGVLPAPAYPPRKNQNYSRLEGIVRDAGASAVLTLRSLSDQARGLLTSNSYLKDTLWFHTDEMECQSGRNGAQVSFPLISNCDAAFIQYTSGSTGHPKGVVVTHDNIIANSSLICQRFGHTRDSSLVSWLPLFHDMGLLGSVVQPIYAGFPATLMNPAYFLQKPIRWLREISRYRATSSGGPNFAYDLCVDEIEMKELEGLDLSSWQRAFNGSEVVQRNTLERFAEKFSAFGFERAAFYPCYGMAETTLIVSGAAHEREPRVLSVDKASLTTGWAVPDEDETACRWLVSCGEAGQGHEVIVVDPVSLQQCEDNQVGEIWVNGPSVSPGYWNKPELNEAVFNAFTNTGKGPYLRTGDLGFLYDNELFATGRLKDTLIIRGRNYYPHDLELTASQAHPALVNNGAAAFLIEADGREVLVVVQEVERTSIRKLDYDATISDIKSAISREHCCR